MGLLTQDNEAPVAADRMCPMITRTILVILAFLLLAAHFLRFGQNVAVAVCLLGPLLLISRQAWARIAVRVLLFTGAAVWAFATFALVHQRVMQGRPWTRMLLILGAVTALTVAAGVCVPRRQA